MLLNRHPYETEIEEALEKAVVSSADKAKVKKNNSEFRGGASSASAYSLQVEKLDRFEGFMRKWEPQLECMQEMISELHAAQFGDDEVDSLSEPVKNDAGAVVHAAAAAIMPPDGAEGSPPGKEVASYSEVDDSEDDQNEENDCEEEGLLKKQSIGMSIVEEEGDHLGRKYCRGTGF
jgi:hypothetical protein